MDTSCTFARWWPALLAPFTLVAALSALVPDAAVVGTPDQLFAIVVIAASLCAAAAIALLWRAHQTDTVELAWVGLFFFACSMLPLVHGITTPGVLYGPNAATASSIALAIPLGLAAAAPAALGRYHMLSRRWRGWVGGWMLVITATCTVLLAAPDLVPVLDGRSPIGLLVIGGSLAGSIALGRRHLVVADVAQRSGPAVIAAGYALVAAAPAVFLGATPYSVGFWAAHIVDIGGVFAATIGGLVVYRRSRSMSEVLKPIIAVDPIAALEVGMHPAVTEFVAELDRKDQMTRDHVVRTAELAIEVAAAMQLPADVQREAGLVGALHDIGKLQIPDEILTKNSALTHDEWQIMRTHPALGADLVAASPPLVSLAPAIRAHHERYDGRGYPDGLAGDQIPLVARIVAACDSFDAMAHSRHYRTGMSIDVVIEELREHAGEQWDSAAALAVMTIAERRPAVDPRLFADAADYACDCLRS